MNHEHLFIDFCTRISLALDSGLAFDNGATFGKVARESFSRISTQILGERWFQQESIASAKFLAHE